MVDNEYYSEGKYRCNHPESDFKVSSTNPIEIKRDKFVEYTHRNETANYRYDVWNRNEGSSNTSSLNLTSKDFDNIQDYNAYVRIKSNSARQIRNNNSSNKKGSPAGVIIFIILIYFLPFLFSILGAILDIVADML